ncbi:hypothetical protein PsAD2_03481 [Pseudovibrio axinellae]|uniref:Uncharacterized protein n=1 Tax=Pseudovibrio axinellae TaxID=989403 RepID=A0A165W9Q0_9HYPH|nr:hypothetical protein PsAD2_03481 [Pseudovibrio axinellae]SER79407.1 hypothetical protein SAMN05421798_1245 [Pseudovibrio axinellae]
MPQNQPLAYLLSILGCASKGEATPQTFAKSIAKELEDAACRSAGFTGT